jgi:serine/threonine protein kinase
MAPEQRLAQPVDVRTDVYGVGVVAYELLAGTPVNLDVASVAEKGIDGWPHLRPLPEVRLDVPPGLDAIVRRALAFDRDARFASCADLEAALEEIATSHPPLASEKAVATWVEQTLADEASLRPEPQLVEPVASHPPNG